MIFHKVDHIYRTIFGCGAGGEKDAVLLVDGAVVVFEIWCVSHILPPVFCVCVLRLCFMPVTSVVCAASRRRVAERLMLLKLKKWLIAIASICKYEIKVS